MFNHPEKNLFISIRQVGVYLCREPKPKSRWSNKMFLRLVGWIDCEILTKSPGLCVLTSPFLTFCDITKGADTSCPVVLFSFTISKHVDGLTKIQFYFEIPATERFSASPSLVTKPIKKLFNVQQSISFRKKCKTKKKMKICGGL